MRRYVAKAAVAVVGIAALAVGGSAIANAASTGGSTTSTATVPNAPTPPPFARHGTRAHEDAEKPVTGDAAAKAQAAAVKYLGGGTAGAVTTDCRGDGYEVTVTKPDGSTTEVHLDRSFTVLQHGHGAGPGGPPPADPPPFG